MDNFGFHRPSSATDASALHKRGDDARYLAGGQTLIPVLKQRLDAPTDLISLSAIDDLEGIKVSADSVSIGAMTTHTQVAASTDVKAAIPALSALAGGIGDMHVRSRGTIGGSVANNDPAADYPAGLLGLGAIIETNQRKISADDFFQGMFTTALEQGELITKIHLPVPARAAYQKFPNPASRYAIVGVFVAQGRDGAVRLAVTGAGQGVFRVSAMEDALTASFAPDVLDSITVPPGDLSSDMHASAAYRAHLITVMAKRAVTAAAP